LVGNYRVFVTNFRSSLSKSLRSLFTGLVVSYIPKCVGRNILFEKSPMVAPDSSDNMTSNLWFVTTLGLEIESLVFLDKMTIVNVSGVMVGFSAASAQHICFLDCGYDLGGRWGRWRRRLGGFMQDQQHVIYLRVTLEPIVVFNRNDARMKDSSRGKWDTGWMKFGK
jgi:hypothetical protein